MVIDNAGIWRYARVFYAPRFLISACITVALIRLPVWPLPLSGAG